MHVGEKFSLSALNRRVPCQLTSAKCTRANQAGLWELWKPKKGESVEDYNSCTILTTAASEAVKPIHHRMPIMLKPSAFKSRLDSTLKDPVVLYRILESRYRDFENHLVSKAVNFPLKNDPSLIVEI